MKKKVKVGPRSTGLSSGYEKARQQGGGIQPGAHPEYQGPKLGNPMKQMSEVVQRMKKPKRSPR